MRRARRGHADPAPATTVKVEVEGAGAGLALYSATRRLTDGAIAQPIGGSANDRRVSSSRHEGLL